MRSAYLGNRRSVVKTLLGSKIYVSTEDRQVAPHLMLDGEWEAWMTRAMQPYLANAVFFDVGANYGWYGLVAQNARARKIVSFEPNPFIFEMLFDTMKLNGIPSELHRKAVGNVEGTLTLHVNRKYPGGGSLVSENWVKLKDYFCCQCDVVCLDAVADDLFLREPELRRHPVVLKADVEGFEAQVVLGASDLLSRKTPSVTAFIEHHQDPEGLHQCKEMLDYFEAQGFVLNLVAHDESIQRITREQLGAIPDAEMLCFRRISA